METYFLHLVNRVVYRIFVRYQTVPDCDRYSTAPVCVTIVSWQSQTPNGAWQALVNFVGSYYHNSFSV